MSYLSFTLSDAFVDRYKNTPVSWGFKDGARNSVAEIVFLRTYSRIKEDGSKETWQDVCRRVVEGMFSIQKDHAKENRLPWSDNKAQISAREAFDRMFHFKWTPPGRGLWMMGTPLVNEMKNSSALQNCAYVSTKDIDKRNPAAPFVWLMEASMLGIGVGFDTFGASKQIKVREPKTTHDVYPIPDTREGWCESTAILINAYLDGSSLPYFDYSQIRPAGSPIKTFGGTAAGPEPLMKLHSDLTEMFKDAIGTTLDSMLILDIANLIGVCVVSGNVRRSAELAISTIDDHDFLNAKNPDAHAYRQAWGWMSNNSVAVKVGDDLTPIVDGIARNGEPGVIWMDTTRAYGRLVDEPDNRDHRVSGYNPCAEQPLESYELCTLVETYLNRHENLDDYERTLKYAYLYAKTVTLIPTHWPETNSIMQRNRRIGISMSGIANFTDNHGMPTLRKWMNSGYAEVRRYDEVYSEWLGVRESIKTTTVKPSGTVSLLAGESPGVHWSPGGSYHYRGVVFQKDDPMVELFRQAGYNVQVSAYTPETSVFIQFPVKTNAKRSEKDVTIFEKINLASEAQRWWSDNAVSVTVSFDPGSEAKYVPTVLAMYEGKLKTVSFLPQGNTTYEQMPYQEIDHHQYQTSTQELKFVNLSGIYRAGLNDAEGERYCTTDTCEIPGK
jgi:ribonucleoside-triphosphate reductase (thioredoxin)